MKKIIALLLCFATLFAFFACGGEDDAPDGYKKASNDEACAYTLYVPENWVQNPGENKTNFTMATVSNTDSCNVSLSVVSDIASGATFEEFWAAQEAQYKTIFHEGFTVVEKGASVKAGGLSAIRCVYTARFGGKDYKYMQVFIPKQSFFSAELYVFTYTASAEKVSGKETTHYDEHLETANAILSYLKWD